MSSSTTSPTQPDQMDCQAAAELLSAFALDALEAAPRASVARHLTGCPRCRQQLEREEAVVALLATAVPAVPPPASLRARLLDEIGAPPAAAAAPATPPASLRARLLHEIGAPPAAAPRRSPLPFRPRRPAGLYLSRAATVGLALVASLLVIGLVVASVLAYQMRDQRDTAVNAQSELAEYLQHGGVVVALARAGDGQTAAGHGSLVIERSGIEGMVMVSDLTPSTADYEYQVWAARGGQRWNVGKLSVGANGVGWLDVKCPQPLTTYDTVGITVVSGGSQHDLLTAAVPPAIQ